MNRITPTWLWRALYLAAACGLIQGLLQVFASGTPLLRNWDLTVTTLSGALAFFLSLSLSLCIAADFQGFPAMRTAWLMIAASSAAAILRIALEWSHNMTGWLRQAEVSFIGLRQIPITLASVLLIAALLLMWSCFAGMGLGISFTGRDLALLALILFLAPAVFWSRERLADSNSTFLLIRYSQYASPMFLASTAALGVVLYRISEEMGGGQLARSLRYLAFSQLLKLCALLTEVTPILRESPAVNVLRAMMWLVAPWLFALAIAYRWEMTARVVTLIRHYEKRPGHPDLALIHQSPSAH